MGSDAPATGRMLSSASRVLDSASLTALHDLDLADSDVPEALERLQSLAQRTLSLPVALVTLVGAGHRVFLDDPFSSGPDGSPLPPRLIRRLRRVVLDARAPVVVDDIRTSDSGYGYLAAEDLGVAAYVAVPLFLDDGEVIGAFCAIERRPRRWTTGELELLEELALLATAILKARAELVRVGLHDRLTGLPNRGLLVASCDEFLSALGEDEQVAVLCAGIDRFNMVNQALGADRADGVLRAVGERLAGAVRDTDVFGRLRGDVFVLIAPGMRDEAEALTLASRVRQILARPVDVDGDPLSVGATLGIALGGRDTCGSDLISEAANAMREAKRGQGRMRVAENGNPTEAAAAHLRLREALHVACERDEIRAVFQPIVALEDRSLVGFEALARWESAKLGSVSPAEFIPLAELSSDIVSIGEAMVRQAADFAAALRERTGRELRVTVNVSPLQLGQADFAESVRDAFGSRGLDGRSVGIEITEGALLQSGTHEQDNLGRLREFGADILLDDFGTGYSALGYLHDFLIDTIKIDRSFIARMVDDRHSAALIQAILAMARGMDMEIVAEGIETEEQAKLLRLLGCRTGQGFGLGRPAAAPEALAGLGASAD